MKLSLYNPQMERIAIIGSIYRSCAWSEGYNSMQPFTLALDATEEYKKKVVPDCYIGRDDRKTLMVIKTASTEKGQIIAEGFQAIRCMDDVAFIGKIEAGENIPAAIKRAYDSTEGFSGITVDPSDIPDTYGHQISNKTMMELCNTMCQAADMGHRVVRDGKQIKLQFYKPTADKNRILREAYGSLRIKRVVRSSQPYKNYAIVLGEGEAEYRRRVDVDIREGQEQRRDIIIDARDIQREEGESEQSYIGRLQARGVETLIGQKRTWEVEMEPLPEEFGKLYDLGDIITAVMPDYDMKLTARITRFTQNSKGNKTETTMEIGQITVMG